MKKLKADHSQNRGRAENLEKNVVAARPGFWNFRITKARADRFVNTISALLVLMVLISGCETFLDPDSDRLVFPDEYLLNSPKDTVYSMVGILAQVEKLADRYVLLGELRGELMDLKDDAGLYLREINNFEISYDNPYNKITDYYSVINNCNYLIANIDTALVTGGEKVLYKIFAATKAIRAWTYMQLALNYQEVKYYEEPILSIQDTGNYVVYTMQELFPLLISDLEPWKYEELPGGISLGVDITSDLSFFPIHFLLGDLYLWTGDYESAASEYYDLIEEYSYIIDDTYKSLWTVEKGVFVERKYEEQVWMDKFLLPNPEQITLIAGSAEFGEGADLDSLTWYYNEIVPSAKAIETWNSQVYYHTSTINKAGDLRGDYGSYFSPDALSKVESEISEAADIDMIDFSSNHITKFTLMATTTTKAIAIYRVSMLYLRYAEAMNRAGRPNLAFAVLKNGLNSETLAEDTIVPRNEKYMVYTDSTGTFYNDVNFEDIVFDDNIGVHAQGCGNVQLANDFIIPPLSDLEDSIRFVEDKIIEELALETAFEGNRFHDLMRIAMRRNDPSYLADIVAEKYTDNKDAIHTKLMNEDNWYLPKK